MDITKIKFFMKFGLIKGPVYILFYLKIIEREKELFTTQLENGQ